MLVIMKVMVRTSFIALFAVGMFTPTVGVAQNDDRSIENCYDVRGEARYGALAYKHVVIVTNRCEVTLQCKVWTDVDPSPKHEITVEPKGTKEVIVRNNSPARLFKAFGECKK